MEGGNSTEVEEKHQGNDEQNSEQYSEFADDDGEQQQEGAEEDEYSEFGDDREEEAEGNEEGGGETEAAKSTANKEDAVRDCDTC